MRNIKQMQQKSNYILPMNMGMDIWNTVEEMTNF